MPAPLQTAQIIPFPRRTSRTLAAGFTAKQSAGPLDPALSSHNIFASACWYHDAAVAEAATLTQPKA